MVQSAYMPGLLAHQLEHWRAQPVCRLAGGVDFGPLPLRPRGQKGALQDVSGKILGKERMQDVSGLLPPAWSQCRKHCEGLVCLALVQPILVKARLDSSLQPRNHIGPEPLSSQRIWSAQCFCHFNCCCFNQLLTEKSRPFQAPQISHFRLLLETLAL